MDLTPDDVRLAFLGYGMDLDLVMWIPEDWFRYHLRQGETPQSMYRIAMACEFPRPVKSLEEHGYGHGV